MGQWNSNEIELLKALYEENNVPSDQLIKNKVELESFSAKFNTRAERGVSFSPEEIADQLLKLRKSSRLPRIRR
jgi:hypothetical protein